MINPTKADIGRGVVYTGNRYPGGQTESGVITSFNKYVVFVRYDGERHSKATDRGDLEWEDVAFGDSLGQPVSGQGAGSEATEQLAGDDRPQDDASLESTTT